MNKFAALLLTALLASGPAWADLNDLKDDVKTEEKKTDEAQKDTKDEAAPTASSSSSGSDPVAEFVARLVVLAWAADNVWTTYEDYPYAGEAPGFVRWPEATGSISSEGLGLKDRGGRNGYLTASLTGFGLDGYGAGAWASLEGHFYRFIGPYLETWTLADGSQRLGGYRLGATFSLIQADPFNLSVYGQFNGWYGVVNRQGGAVGLQLRTYPFRPLVLEARLGGQLFEKFSVSEGEFQLGWLFGRYEVVAGVRSWTITDDRTTFGLSGGLRMWL